MSQKGGSKWQKSIFKHNLENTDYKNNKNIIKHMRRKKEYIVKMKKSQF